MLLHGGHVLRQQEAGASQETQEEFDFTQQGIQIGFQEFSQVCNPRHMIENRAI